MASSLTLGRLVSVVVSNKGRGWGEEGALCFVVVIGDFQRSEIRVKLVTQYSNIFYWYQRQKNLLQTSFLIGLNFLIYLSISLPHQKLNLLR